MPEVGSGDVGLFQALPGPHSPILVGHWPTGDSHWGHGLDRRSNKPLNNGWREFEQDGLCPHSALTNASPERVFTVYKKEGRRRSLFEARGWFPSLLV